MVRRLTATVTGTVQGVGYRWYVQRIACSSHLTGYVRNTDDGGVEVVAEGEEITLHRLLESLRAGPPGARVTRVEVQWQEPTAAHSEFAIRN